MNDRRKESRLVERNQVRIWPTADKDGGPVINASTHDISTGGARIHSNHSFDVGTVVELEVHLARTKQSVTLKAEVKWCRKKYDENEFELGVEFQHRLTTTLLALIRHLYDPEERIPSSLM